MSASEQDRQIVVATDHLRVVGAELGERATARPVHNARLNLSLLTLSDVDVDAAARRHPAPPRTGGPPSTVPALDRLLHGLRQRFAKRYDGWIPTMGKNRTLTGVQFKPYSNGGGVARPERATAPGTFPPAPGDGARVRVGLLDTRFAPHTALAGRYVADADALVAPVTDGRQRLWWEGHSTFIAGVIRRHAPSAVLDVRSALRPVPGGDGEEWTMALWDFADRLAEYRDAGVAVLNLSVGVSTDDGRPPLVLERAIARLTSDIVVVAASGNHGSAERDDDERRKAGLPVRRAAMFPAALDDVLAVGALGPEGIAGFTPRGADNVGTAPWIDVFAPGVDVVSTYLGDGGGEKVLVRCEDGSDAPDEFGGWASWSGTSFAAGEITGAVAAQLAAGRDREEAVAAVRARYSRPGDAGA